MKKRTRRQRLKRDPINQRPHSLRGWAKRHGFGPAVTGTSAPPHNIGGHRYTYSSLGYLWRNIFYRFERLRRGPPELYIHAPKPKQVVFHEDLAVVTFGGHPYFGLYR